MSDEFQKVAREEISEHIENLKKIVNSSKNDSDVSKKILDLTQLLHEIEGLAPMMNQNKVGKIAQRLHLLLNAFVEKNMFDGAYEMVNSSIFVMYDIFSGKNNADTNIEIKIDKALLDILQ